MRNFRDLEVWQEAIMISSIVYQITSDFPEVEKFNLTRQLQRSSVSIASNIAEGCSRTSSKDFGRFIEIAIGSAFELETQIEIAQLLGYLPIQTKLDFILRLNTLQKRLNSLRISILK